MSNGIDFSLVFDALVAVLLVATIVYAAILNRKLSNLRDLKSEMEALVSRLVESTKIAEVGLQNLRGEAERSGETMQCSAEMARGIADELGFLIEKGDALARRIEGALATARGSAKSAPQADQAVSAAATDARPSPRREVSEPTPVFRTAGANANRNNAESAPSPQEAALLKALQGLR